MVSIQEAIQFLLRPLATFLILVYVLLWLVGRKTTDLIRSLTGLHDGIKLDAHNLRVSSLTAESGRQEQQLRLSCRVDLQNNTYFELETDRMEVTYEFFGEHDRIDTREDSRFQLHDIASHSERRQDFYCPIPWHAVRDSSRTNEPYLDGHIEVDVTPLVTFPVLTSQLGWKLRLETIRLNKKFDAQIPTEAWHLSANVSHEKPMNEASWEEVSEQTS